MGNLSNLGFGMANTITQNQANDGATAQAVVQQLINAGMSEFDAYKAAGNLGLSGLQNGVAATPGAQNTTSTSNPGLAGMIMPFL